jgi:small subunit ribosomal protein S6
MNKNYETVFILTPVLSEAQMEDAVEKFRKTIIAGGGELVSDENWGLKKLAYPIMHKSTGFYHLFEFIAAPEFIKTLETEYRRDERVMRYITVSLDKHAITYNERRRKGEFNKKKEETAA